MRNRLIFSSILLLSLIMLFACSPGDTQELTDEQDGPAATNSTQSNNIEIVDMDPNPGSGLSANDPILLVIRYNLIPKSGVLEVWYERFQDPECTVRGFDDQGNFILPGTSLLTMDGGYFEMGIAMNQISPVDTDFLGVGVRLWDSDISEILAEDIQFEWCYAARPAVAVLTAERSSVPYDTDAPDDTSSVALNTPASSTPPTPYPPGPTENPQTPPDVGATPTWTAEPTHGDPTPTWTLELPSLPASTGTIIISAFVDADSNGSMESYEGTADYPLPGLGVIIATEDCLTTITNTATGSSGNASVTGLFPGNYCVIIDYAGFGTLTPGRNTWVAVLADMNSFAVFTVVP